MTEQWPGDVLTVDFSLLSHCTAEEPSEVPQPPARKTPQLPAQPSTGEAPTEPPQPRPSPPHPPPKDPVHRLHTGQWPVLPQRPQQPLPLPGRPGLALPGSTGVLMETGEAGPPGRMGMSGRGLPQGVDGQMGQAPIPSAEGYAGAPGKPRWRSHRRDIVPLLCCRGVVGPEPHPQTASKGAEEPIFADLRANQH